MINDESREVLTVGDLIRVELKLDPEFRDHRDNTIVVFGDNMPITSVVGRESLRLVAAYEHFTSVMAEYISESGDEYQNNVREMSRMLRDVLAVVCNG